jgi:VanZ family protein
MMENKWRWIPPIIWGILLAVLSLMPTGDSQIFLFHIPYMDKVAHFGMYVIWAFLVVYAWTSNSSLGVKKVIWLTFLFGTFLGIILEFGQYSMSFGRSFEIADVVANGVGSIVGAWLGKLYYKL